MDGCIPALWFISMIAVVVLVERKNALILFYLFFYNTSAGSKFIIPRTQNHIV